MKNQYWLITVPGKNSTNFQNALLHGKKTGLPFQVMHWRWNQDETKAIIQGDLSDEDIKWLETKPWATLLGEYVNNKAETKVHDYIASNAIEWKTPLV